MLCPSNPQRISATYLDLLQMEPIRSKCVDRIGGPPLAAPDGTLIKNVCQKISDLPSPSLGRRRRIQFVTEAAFDKDFNTNYTASWFLVRGGVVLDANGNLRAAKPGCGTDILSRNTTTGPLSRTDIDNSPVASAAIPLLGDGAPGEPLPFAVGPNQAGDLTTQSFTAGPRLRNTLEVPTFAPSTARSVYWAVWNDDTRQDYRGFGIVHRGECNVLMADGSVHTFEDTNEDGLLNTGFAAVGGFLTPDVEVADEQMESQYSLSESISR
jgi:prepilin-type processing-associated H-X9-DG protein